MSTLNQYRYSFIKGVQRTQEMGMAVNRARHFRTWTWLRSRKVTKKCMKKSIYLLLLFSILFLFFFEFFFLSLNSLFFLLWILVQTTTLKQTDQIQSWNTMDKGFKKERLIKRLNGVTSDNVSKKKNTYMAQSRQKWPNLISQRQV